MRSQGWDPDKKKYQRARFLSGPGENTNQEESSHQNATKPAPYRDGQDYRKGKRAA